MPDCPAAAQFARVAEACTTLAELAAGPDGDRLGEVLACDALALARMRAGAAVVRAAGMPVDLDSTDADLLIRAARWHRYADGPVSPLHSACGRDIARGLLRLWAGRQRPAPGSAVARRTRLAQDRVQVLGRVRTGCAALRAELRRDATALGRGHAAAFAGHVARRVGETAGELQDAADWQLGAAGPPAEVVHVDLEPPPPARLEHRLSVLLGAGFGTGAALTLARFPGELLPAWTVLPAAASGVLLGVWVARTRRLLGERAVHERWVVEVTAALRAALEEYVATRSLAAAVNGSAADGNGPPGDYRPGSRRR